LIVAYLRILPRSELPNRCPIPFPDTAICAI